MNAAALSNSAWLASNLPAWHRFRRALRDPEQSQRAVLRQLVARNADCAFGQTHGFSAIRSYEDWVERVPLSNYESLEPWIERIARGQSSVLTSEPVLRLLPTSGSTGARKLIPFTASLQREFNAAIGPWMVDLCWQHPTVALGPAYWSISPAIALDPERLAVPIGFDKDSAYLGLRGRFAESALAGPSALRLVSDIEAARYLTLLCLLRRSGLRLVSVWHPSFLTLLLDALPGFWRELISDVASGECRDAAQLPEAVRGAVCGRSQPRRARELRELDPTDPCSLWPRLRVVSCWADAQSAWPAAALATRLPGVTIQPKGLLATEGVISVPFHGHHPLAVCSHFLEFADDAGRVWRSGELKLGGTYRVIITTGSGLWRYQLGDLVEVDAFVERTPSVKFLGRGQGVSDLCGEKLAEEFVTRAITAALQACAVNTAFALLAPENRDSRWHYTLFAEGNLPDHLALKLDQELQANPHYELCQKLDQLGGIELCRLTKRATEHYLQLKTGEGQRLGEVKPPSLSARPDWRERLRDCLL